jgi:hypothetical protein
MTTRLWTPENMELTADLQEIEGRPFAASQLRQGADAERRAARLEAALRAYGAHLAACRRFTCPKCHNDVRNHDNLRAMGYGVCNAKDSNHSLGCTCGFDTALTSPASTPEETT